MDDIVKFGKRPLKVNPDEVEIVAAGDWRLVECTKYSSPPWKSLKLYLNRAAAKNVWRLGLSGTHRAKTKDGFLLQQFYPPMWDWITAHANGRHMELPEGSYDEATVFVPPKIYNFVVEAVERRDPARPPLSHKAQTRSQGRYIIDMVAAEFGVSELVAKIYLKAMLNQGVLQFVMFSKHKRLSGLRLTEVSNG